MTAEQFEQAKQEFAIKTGHGSWNETTKQTDVSPLFLTYLTSLLEQHKEVITAEIKRADFAEWLLNHATVNEEFTPPKWTAYLSGYQSKTYWTTNELYDVWLKNVKK